MFIVVRLLVGAVVVSIYFDDESCLVTEEVHDVGPHLLLASELESQDTASPQSAPQRFLGSSGVIALIAGTFSEVINGVKAPQPSQSCS